MCDEIGESGTYHTHVFFIAKNAVMFDTVQSRFYGAHIEKALGSNEENYNYVRKIGEKYSNKSDTNLPDTFEEYGTLPADKCGNNSLSAEIVEMITDGCSNYDIIKTYPQAMRFLSSIEQTRQIMNEEKAKNTFRQLDTVYLWGKTGTGKTRHVMEKYGYSNVYRVTDYAHPFDGYKGQDVILFDEFRSSLKISDMLVYLDGYPLTLPCRYANKTALYTKVFIATNIPINKQYPAVQLEEPETYRAFLRRIHRIEEISADTDNNAQKEIILLE